MTVTKNNFSGLADPPVLSCITDIGFCKLRLEEDAKFSCGYDQQPYCKWRFSPNEKPKEVK